MRFGRAAVYVPGKDVFCQLFYIWFLKDTIDRAFRGGLGVELIALKRGLKILSMGALLVAALVLFASFLTKRGKGHFFC